MIGQNGLPMMNNLAGSNEKTPDDVKTKTPTGEAGAFEKILMPNVQASAVATDSKALAEEEKRLAIIQQGSSPSDVRLAGDAVARGQTEANQFVRPKLTVATEGESATRSVFKQSIEPIAAAIETVKNNPNTGQQLATNIQTLATAAEDVGAESQSLVAAKPMATPDLSIIDIKAQSQKLADSQISGTTEIGDKATSPETLAVKTATAPDPSGKETKTSSEVSPGNPIPQTTELDDKATPFATLTETAGRPGFPDSSRLGEINISQNQTETSLSLIEAGTSELGAQLGKPIVEASKLATSPDGPVLLATSTDAGSAQVISSRSEREIRLSQQASPLPTASLPDPVSETIAATQGKSNGDADTTAFRTERSETSARLVANLSSELKALPPQSQAEFSQNQPGTLTSRSDMRSAVTLTGAASQQDLAATPPINSSSLTEGGGLKAMVQTPAPQTQGIVPETLFSAQGAMSEQLDILLGPTAAVTSTGSSRLDVSAVAPLPASADPKLIAHQINQAIIRMDGTRTEIMLDPVELGRVSLTFITKDEGVTVLINADRPETADLLRRNSEQLQRDLSNAGYEGVELDFDQDKDAHPDPSTADRFDEIGTTGSSSVSYESSFITSGLDIRI